jgi:hypothetical protein
MEHHELSCAPLGGDGCVPDEENPPPMGEALATFRPTLGLGQVASRAEVSNVFSPEQKPESLMRTKPPRAEFASTACAPKLTAELELWVSSKVDEAREKQRKKVSSNDLDYQDS